MKNHHINAINTERESSGKKNNSISNNHHHRQHHHNTTSTHRDTERLGIGADTLRTRSSATSSSLNHDAPDFVLQWGNKKRLRCMKIQTKDDTSDPANRTTARVDRRVIRTDFNQTGQFVKHRPAPASPPRLFRNFENMKGSSQGHGNMGMVENNTMHIMQEGKRAGHVSVDTHHNYERNNNSNDTGFEITAHEEGNNKKGGGGSSYGGEVILPAVWPPKFVIALTNKEKEEDFMAIKGSKLPQRPKKRSKCVQRNLKLVNPGAWLCDLTLDRYEVREKKTSKKRPRGLKAMCSTTIDSESE